VTGVAVTNTTCLIVLDRIGRLDILSSSFARIVLPSEVQEEFGAIPAWCTEQRITNTSLYAALSVQLGRGEAAAITLATEIQGSMIILDDRKARRIAQQMGLPVLGTIGILLRAKRSGVIARLAPILDQFDAAGFRVSGDLRTRALLLAEESEE